MIRLDYRTNNLRWGQRGIVFDNWVDYSFVLGFLANINHYKGHTGNSIWNDSIFIVKERNDNQGAWSYENRILYYGNIDNLSQNIPTLSNASSSGVNDISRRINSNEYINDLINEFNFIEQSQNDNTTIIIFPPNITQNDFSSLLSRKLSIFQIDNIQECINSFNIGYNL